MTHRDHRNRVDFEAQADSESPGSFHDLLELLVDHGFDCLAQAMQTLLNEAMKLERSQVLGAQPYERTPERRGYANGFKAKTLRTRLGTLELAVPQAGGVEFYPSALERGTRSERALAAAVAETYLQGVSPRKVTTVMEQLCGREVTSMQVSRAVQALDEELTAWRERSLGEMPYLFLDARYEKVRIGGTVALLVALGVQPDGRRSVLGLSVSLSEAEVHWREFVAGLQARGLHLPERSLTCSAWPPRCCRRPTTSGKPRNATSPEQPGNPTRPRSFTEQRLHYQCIEIHLALLGS